MIGSRVLIGEVAIGLSRRYQLSLGDNAGQLGIFHRMEDGSCGSGCP